MKKTFALIVGCICYAFAWAQDANNEMEMARQIFGKEWKSLTGEALSLSDAESQKFWPIWDEYRGQRKAISDTRVSLIKDYADNFDKMTDSKASELARGVLKNDAALNKLKGKYFKKMSKAVSPTRAAQFLQLENYLDAQVKAAISDALPFLPDPVK